MFSWNNYDPEDYELEHLKNLIKKELKNSEKIEEIVFSNKKKKPKHYYMIHRSLKFKLEK